METFNLKFTIEQIYILDKALQQMPYKDAAPLINNINLQIKEQQSKIIKNQTNIIP